MIRIYVKGSCVEGAGGWAAKIVTDSATTTVIGKKQFTTTPEMEIKAAIEGISSTPPHEPIIVHNTYIASALRQSKKNGPNTKLWECLNEVVNSRLMRVEWRQWSHDNEHMTQIEGLAFKRAKLTLATRNG